MGLNRLVTLPDPRPERDGLTGVTAMEHGFTLVTRNVADVQIQGIKLLNPLDATR